MLHEGGVLSILLVLFEATDASKRLKVQELTPPLGPHAGGILVNVSGKGELLGFNAFFHRSGKHAGPAADSFWVNA